MVGVVVGVVAGVVAGVSSSGTVRVVVGVVVGIAVGIEVVVGVVVGVGVVVEVEPEVWSKLIQSDKRNRCVLVLLSHSFNYSIIFQSNNINTLIFKHLCIGNKRYNAESQPED